MRILVPNKKIYQPSSLEKYMGLMTGRTREHRILLEKERWSVVHKDSYDISVIRFLEDVFGTESQSLY